MFARLNVHNIHTTNEPSESVVAGSSINLRAGIMGMSGDATLSTTSALHLLRTVIQYHNPNTDQTDNNPPPADPPDHVPQTHAQRAAARTLRPTKET
jgi:hypothetical protein